MSKPTGYGSSGEVEDALQQALDTVARFLMVAGALASLVALGFLIYTFAVFATGSPASTAQAESNIEIFRMVLLAGVAAVGVGTAYSFWGEETLGILQLVFAGLLYFAPLFLPGLLSGGQVSPVGSLALGAIQQAGIVFGTLAVVVLVIDLSVRAKARAQQGSRADQLKYGKNVKEEKDIQNVFLGKCWQLPFCRKFVRERCPIYHSRRTCWKERVGCMCEEEVIRNAMENKPIPKDMVASAKFIPYNNRITMDQKKERCRQCVIYNEHQKHKYRALMPLTLTGLAAIYVAFRLPMLAATGNLVQRIDGIVGIATFRSQATETNINASATIVQELLLICFFVIALAYLMKLIEFLVFKLKI